MNEEEAIKRQLEKEAKEFTREHPNIPASKTKVKEPRLGTLSERELENLRQLADENMEEICAYLLPRGKRVGSDYKCGNLEGDRGKDDDKGSLSVILQGPRRGVWKDFATDEAGGDMISLWAAVRNYSPMEAIIEMKGWFEDCGYELGTVPVKKAPANEGGEDPYMQQYPGFQLEPVDEELLLGLISPWRGYSNAFCKWLNEHHFIGRYGKNMIALPAHDCSGKCVKIHYLFNTVAYFQDYFNHNNHSEVKKEWRQHPIGLPNLPMVVGSLTPQLLFMCESQWDGFCFIEQEQLFTSDIEWTLICTWGAAETRIPALKTVPQLVYLLGQRDEPNAQWRKKVCNRLNRPVKVILPPEGFKDLNEWVKQAKPDATAWNEVVRKAIEMQPQQQLPLLHLPSVGITTWPECTEECYKGLAATERYFLRDNKLVYPEHNAELNDIVLHTIDEYQFISQLERIFQLRRKEHDAKKTTVISKATQCRVEEARIILKDRVALQKYSLPLRLIAAYPVLIERDGEPVVLQGGYHRDEGGIYVINSLELPPMGLEEAKECLLDLFADYQFVSPSDQSRAIAQVLSPALKLGNLLGNADFPLDVALAAQSQSGKTHRMKMTALIYGERAYVLTKNQGVGSLDELVATALLAGKLFILIDNLRGEIDSHLLESILRGVGSVSTRRLYSAPILAKTGRSCWQLTSNAASFTPDLAKRSLVTSHQKQPEDYQHKSKLGWGEEVYRNIQAKPEHLRAVHAIIGEWITRGKPKTDESRHDFRETIQALDYTVKKILGLAPLMDNHYQAYRVLSDESFAWLRQVVVVIQAESKLPVTMRAWELAELCVEHGVKLPKQHAFGGNDERMTLRVGQVMGAIFKSQKSNQVELNGCTVTRTEVKGTNHIEKTYTLSSTGILAVLRNKLKPV